MKDNDYGKIAVGTPGDTIELKIVDFVQSENVDNRVITVATLEDETVLLLVENPESTGRAPKMTMRLSKESLVALSGAMMLYYAAKDLDLHQEVKDSATKHGKIGYRFSDNLEDPMKKINI